LSAGAAKQQSGTDLRFRDFIDLLYRMDSESSLQAWRKHLADFESPTDLAKLKPATASSEQTYAHESWIGEAWLGQDSTSELTRCLHTQRWTLATVVQCLWSLLLAELSGQRDVVFGLVVSGRDQPLPGIDSVVGLFVNTVPMRVKVDPLESIVELLTRVQQEQVQLRAHAHIKLSEIQKHAGFRGVPLFETAVVIENYPLQSGRRSGELVLSGAEATERVGIPLVLMVIPGRRLRFRLLYDNRLFAREPIDSLVHRVAHLLELLPAYLGRKVQDLLPALAMVQPCMHPASNKRTASWDHMEVPPRNATERALQEIWRRVLRPARCGVTDDFYALGGDSLALMRLHHEISAAFTQAPVIADLLQYTTIEQVAKLMGAPDAAVCQGINEAIERSLRRKSSVRYRREQKG
jgi:non-ribosomal peptide synthetase component F